MSNILEQRCFNHARREAVARCPECGRFFCRECVSEHDDRILCSACLKKLAHVPLTRRPMFRKTFRFAQCAAGIVLVWFFFFLAGELLLKIPTSFHEGTLWHVMWIDRQ